MSATMSKVRRSSVAVLATALAVPLCTASPASAASSSEPASNGAYFYSAGIDKPEEAPAAPPNVTAIATDGVAAEHLAVAVRAPNQVDKLSFLFFDLAAVPFDATISKAVVTVPLAENGGGNVQMDPAASKVLACEAGDEGFSGEDGANTASAPKTLCDAFKVVGKDSPDKKSYVFDVTALAQSWLSTANNGMALTPASTASPFQAVFLPMDRSTLAVEYTAPPPDTGTGTGGGGAPVPPPATGGTGVADAGSSAGGFTGGSGPALDAGGDVGSAEAPVVDSGSAPLPESAAAAAPAPATAAPQVAGGAVRTVAAATAAPLTPPITFWVGCLLFAGLLALLGLILGDTRVPVRRTSQSLLSRALQQRERSPGGLRRPTTV